MSEVGKLWVSITAKTDEFQRGMQGVERGLMSAQRKIDSTSKKFANFGKVMTIGVTVPIAAAFKGILDAAMHLEATEAKFNTVFQGMTDEASAFIAEFKKLTPLTTAEARGVASGIQDLLVPMGFLREDATKLTGKFMPLIGALANFNNATHTAAEVAQAVSSALVGEYEPMRRLGVVTNKTAIDQRVLAMGLADTEEAITDQMRAIALHEIITESSKDAIAAYTEANLDAKTRMGLLRVEIIDMAANLGQALLPMINEAVAWVKRLTEGFKNLTAEQQVTILKIAAVVAAIGPTSYLVSGILGLISKLISLKVAFGSVSTATGVTAVSSMTSYTSGMSAVGGAAVGAGSKLAALASAAGPIATVVAALAIGAIYWNEYMKAMSLDVRNFEQVVDDSFKGVMSTMVSSQTKMEISQAKSRETMLRDEIKYYREKGKLTATEEKKLAELVEEANKERMYIASLELIERLRASEKFQESMKNSESKTNDEIIQLAKDRRAELVAVLEQETADRIHEIDKRHAAAGTINSKAHVDEIAAEKAHFSERLRLLNAQMGEELRTVQTELSKRGLVYNEELGKIITIQDQQHRNLQSRLRTDMAAMRAEYGLLGRRNVQEYKRGIEAETGNAVAAARNVAARTRTALSETSYAYGAGRAIGKGFADGILSRIDDVVNAARRVATAGKNALGSSGGTSTGGSTTTSGKTTTTSSGGNTVTVSSGSKLGWAGLFNTGGIVPGPIGAPQLALVHGGETILPTHKGGGGASMDNTIRHEIDLINVPATVDKQSLEAGLTEMLNSPQVKRRLDRISYENTVNARGLGI